MTSTADPLRAEVVADPQLPHVHRVTRRDRLAWWMYRLHQRSPRWVGPAAAGVCIAGAVGYTFAVQPTAVDADSASTCLAKITTGFACPGCGGTRAAWYLLHGDVPDAARHHALFVFAVPFLLYMYVSWALNTSFGWRLPQLRLTPRTISVFLAVWAAFSVLRNLPWAPFTLFYI